VGRFGLASFLALVMSISSGASPTASEAIAGKSRVPQLPTSALSFAGATSNLTLQHATEARVTRYCDEVAAGVACNFNSDEMLGAQIDGSSLHFQDGRLTQFYVRFAPGVSAGALFAALEEQHGASRCERFDTRQAVMATKAVKATASLGAWCFTDGVIHLRRVNDSVTLLGFVTDTTEATTALSPAARAIIEAEPDVPATPRGRLVIQTSDIPSQLYAPSERAKLTVTYDVTGNGDVIGCHATMTSGYPALDAHVCRLVSERFKYNPALKDGAAVRSTKSLDFAVNRID
jgi:hypothetical protein